MPSFRSGRLGQRAAIAQAATKCGRGLEKRGWALRASRTLWYDSSFESDPKFFTSHTSPSAQHALPITLLA